MRVHFKTYKQHNTQVFLRGLGSLEQRTHFFHNSSNKKHVKVVSFCKSVYEQAHNRITNPQEHKENAFVRVISVNLSFPILSSAPKASELYYLYSIPVQLLLRKTGPLGTTTSGAEIAVCE